MAMSDRERQRAAQAPRRRARREMARAGVVFVLLSLLMSAIAVNLMFRDLGLQALMRQLDLGRAEARLIAEVIYAIGRSSDGLDFSRVRASEGALEQIINERLGLRPFVRHVEVRDRFGSQFLFVARGQDRTGPLLSRPGGVAAFGEETSIVTAELRRGSQVEGEVRVGIAEGAARRDLEELRRSLRLKVLIAFGLAGALLIVGLVYVIYLIRKNRGLEQQRLEAERRSYVGLLASGLAHEIRNPLNAMNMNLQMLEEELQGAPGLDDSDHNELLDSTKSEIKRLEQVVSNFLVYARPAEPRYETLDLNDVVGKVARFLRLDFEQHQVGLELDLDAMLPSVEVDENQFRQALLNLLVNARQVLSGGGTVTVRSRTGAAGEVLIEVIDDGPGIPAGIRERIFDVFYSSRGGGTGLGLPIARQIIERHGGTLEVESTEGEGTRFQIRLPRKHARRPARAEGKVEATS